MAPEHPSSLHICNLANVAYGFVKLLRADGDEAEVRCHDLKHLMSQPEWDDLELLADDFPDEYNFYDNTADFGQYCRPPWFLSTGILPEHFVPPPTAQPASPLEVPVRPTPPSQPTFTTGHGPSWYRSVWRRLPPGVRRALKPKLRQAQFAHSAWKADLPVASVMKAYHQMSGERLDHLVDLSRAYEPEFHVTRDMLMSFVPHAWWAREHSREFDLVVAYVLSPIYAMLLGDRPYVTVEIGTMREIPFDGTDTGKLLALAYRLAPHALITNPDVREQADQLGLESYSFVPHPLDEEVYRRSSDDTFRADLLSRLDVNHVLFAPARQNWDVKGNDRYLKAFARLRNEGRRIALVIPGWGQEVDRSKQLCRDLGVADAVEWIPPQSEAMLVKYYTAADIVLDQFVLGVFGLTTPKAMSCGAAVVTSYRPEAHVWAFPEHPPLVPASEEGEIYEALRRLVDDPEHLARVGEESRRWVEQYHSKAVIRSAIHDAMGIATDRHQAMQSQVVTGSSL